MRTELQTVSDPTPRRRYARIEKSFIVRCGNPNGTFDELIGRNISRNGMFVVTPTPHSIGEKLEFIIVLHEESDDEITVYGQVVGHVRPRPSTSIDTCGMCIEFILIEPKLKERLDEFIDSLLDFSVERDRRLTRLRIQIPIRFHDFDIVTRTSNVSSGGCFVQFDHDTLIDRIPRISISLYHPITDSELLLTAELVHSHKFFKTGKCTTQQIGLKFVDLSEQQIDEIHRFLKQIIFVALH